MTRETKQRIHAYEHALPGMKERVFAAVVLLLIASAVAVTTTYAWVTLSRAPEVANITTTLAANGSLEIALSKENGSEPDDFDIDESITGSRDVIVTNLQWGNLVNLSDDRYGIENLALRPARLNTSSLLNSPLWGAVYGSDGRVTNLDSNYAYVKYVDRQFQVSNDSYGVRAIASYKATIADSTQQAYNEKVQAVMSAHQKVNETYSVVPAKFSPLGTMISKYAQDKLDKAAPGTNLAPYLGQVIDCFQAVYNAMLDQKDAYVALANFQSYMNAQNTHTTFTEVTWGDLVSNKSAYNAASTSSTSSNKIISLVGLTQFITDLGKMESDLNYLNLYYQDYQSNGVPYYWGQKGETSAYPSGPNINVFIADLIDHGTMTIDLEDNGTERAVTSLSASDATALLGANNKERKAYVYNGIIKRFEQSSVDESYRLNGNAACTIKVTYVMTITVKGKAYTKASGPCDFMTNYSAAVAGSNLIPSDAVAEDTYGLVIDIWARTNAEQTCLTLEGATTTDEAGNIMSYDGINRVWGSTGEAVLTTDSTTQGGGSCYIYYADTPEDMMRSLSLLDAMKVAFVDESGNLMARASMDTVNYYAVNGRITVPLVLDSDTKTTYTYTNELNEELVGRAITTLYTDNPIRIETIVYLDGDLLTNDDVLAAAEIQGQLNLQFGSSTNLKTVGSNELIDDTRSVTATVSKNSMDYDKAVVDADLTTEVTLNVQGTDPRQVTAFFVRAINSTQGSREKTMTFTKQADGSWTTSYKFTAPGTYYLRHVRLDGVDYALAEPPKVEVSGFTLESLTWGEPGSSAVIRTSANTYSETVSVKFAGDQSKLPTSVQARFVRTDGNTVNIPLTYSSSTNQWTGTGTFSTSGVYTLEYLVFDNKYKDLVSLNMDKTLDLSLGMYAAVYQNGGTLTDRYESGKTYSKDVWVKIFDNTGKELEALEGAVLFYSNGGSATGTINTDLTWNEVNGYYDGTLPIVNAGRYRFSSVMLEGNNSLTKCTESPVYTIISPDPPRYDTASACTYNGDNIQFVPLTNNAVIDNILIDNAASATAAAVVYNSETGNYYTAPMTYTGNGSKWYAALPTYGVQTGTDAENKPVYEQSQEGTWSVAAIKLWDCYDGDSQFRQEANPILWVANDEIGTNYLDSLTDENGSAITPDGTYDFSKLSTTVSGKVNVVMTPGTTALGGSDTPFGTVYQTRELGMSVKLTDGAGRVIPANKVTDVTLNVIYNQPTDASYGYKVNTGNNDYPIALNKQDAEDGVRTVSSSDAWQYVGEYQVQNLTVTIGDKTLTFTSADNIGVPEMYTLRTAAPTADCVELQDVRHTVTTFGKTGNNVIGTFLESCNLNTTNMKIALKGAGGQIMTGAVMEGVEANLKLTYKGGSQANGGYTFDGDTGYQNLTIPMTLGQNTDTYTAGSSVLLAGTYGAAIEYTINGGTETYPLSDISVYSMKPTVDIVGVIPTPSNSITVNTIGGSGTVDSSVLFTAQNSFDSKLATVYIGYAVGSKPASDGSTDYSNMYADYTLPRVQFELKNGGTFDSAQLVIENENDKPANIASFSNGFAETDIGYIKPGEETRYTGLLHKEVKYSTETPYCTGLQTVNQIQMTNGAATYSVDLTDELTICEVDYLPPAISFAFETGFSTPVGKESETGASFQFTLPTVEEYGEKTSTGSKEQRDEIPNKGGITKPLPTGTNLNWGTGKPIETTKEYYLTSTVAIVNNNHRGSGLSWFSKRPGYQKQYTFKYYLTETKEYTAQGQQTTNGTTTVEVTKTDYKTKQVLKHWLVNNTIYMPGETITVSGRWIAEPVLDDPVETTLRVTTVTTNEQGEIVDEYIRTKTEIVTTRSNSDPYLVGTKYCAHDTCDTCTPVTKESGSTNNDDAKAAAEGTIAKPSLPADHAGYDEIFVEKGADPAPTYSDWKFSKNISKNVTSSTTRTVIVDYVNGVPNATPTKDETIDNLTGKVVN